MKPLALLGAGILTIGMLAGSSWAGDLSKADMDFCNQKAGEASTPSPVQPGARAERQPQSGSPSSGNTMGTPVSPSPSAQSGTGSPQSGNPTGGRITDSSQPGTPPSAQGMAPAGETDLKYRQAYLACLSERTK